MPIGRRTRWSTNHQGRWFGRWYGWCTRPIGRLIRSLARAVCWMESTVVGWQDGECHGGVSSASKIRGYRSRCLCWNYEMDIDSFFYPPCIPMPFLGKALNPVPVWLMLVIPSMFGYGWVVSSTESDVPLMLSDSFFYRTGNFTDVVSITSFTRDVVHNAVPSMWRNWILGACKLLT